jgi:cytochrome c-type biogenesis protein
MLFFLISFLAGILTVLAPCILPLLPIVIGSSNTKEDKKVSLKSVRIIAALAVSVVIFTLLLKASTLLIEIPPSFWTWFSGIVVVILGVVMVWPKLWTKIPLVNKIKNSGNKQLAVGHQKNSHKGDYIVGLSLGPVFSTCSPTYLFIIATVLPASFAVGFIYLIGFTLGLVVSLLLVAYFGQAIVNKVTTNSEKAEKTKKVFGVLILVIGISIIMGWDKDFEAWVLDSGYGATINFEERLINQFGN